MSHELRTPLNAILGFAPAPRAGRALGASSARASTRSFERGRHLLSLINEVLDISRIEAGRLQLSLEPVPLQETRSPGDASWSGRRPRLPAVTVRADAIDDELHVLADRQRLQQVLLNLLSNAIKYNRPGGSVAVSCRGVTGDRLRIAVTDTGPGHPADKLARLFTPFDRLGAEASAVEGTGLGLALSKALVEAMGGTLRVQSQQGVGSTFSVDAGRSRRRPSRRAASAAGDDRAAAGRRPSRRAAHDSLHRGQPVEPAPRRAACWPADRASACCRRCRAAWGSISPATTGPT